LEQIPAQWAKYREQFASLERWMDGVDQNIATILNQVDSLEQFEKERTIFQVSNIKGWT